MDEEEMIAKGLRYRPTIRSAVTYIVDPITGAEIESPAAIAPDRGEKEEDHADETIRQPVGG